MLTLEYGALVSETSNSIPMSVDIQMAICSDAGSTPAASIQKKLL